MSNITYIKKNLLFEFKLKNLHKNILIEKLTNIIKIKNYLYYIIF